MASKKKKKAKSMGFFYTVVFITLVIFLLVLGIIRVFSKGLFPTSKLKVVEGSVSSDWYNKCNQNDYESDKDTIYCVKGKVENTSDKTAYGIDFRFDVYEKGQWKETMTHDYCLREVEANGIAEFSCRIKRRFKDEPKPTYEVKAKVNSAKYYFQDMLWEIAEDWMCDGPLNYCGM